MSSNENKLKNIYNPYYQKVYSNVPLLYEKFEKNYSNYLSHIPRVNIHKAFKNLSSKIDHFGDVCHLLEPGNEISATEYYKKFREIILKWGISYYIIG